MPLTKPMKIIAAGGGLFFYFLLLQFLILPMVTKMQTRKKIALKPGWERRILWDKYPFTQDLSFYIFNVTNPDQIKAGEKPILQQVGPFVYEQHQEKTNRIDRDEDDTVSFTLRNTYFFSAEKSKDLTGDEEIVIANLFALGLVNTLVREKPSALPIFGKAIDILFKKPDNLFMKTTPKKILFEGIPIDCTAKDFAGAAICSEVREKYEEFGMIKTGEDEYLFSLMATRNGTDAKKPTRVLRGLKNIMDVGRVVEYNYKNNLSTWDDEYCDRLNGSDGTIFHPNFDKHGKDPMLAFNDGLCRTVAITFEKKSKFRGIKTLQYTTDLGTDPDNPLHKCYCQAPDKCLKKGVYDAYKCIGSPVVISNPHFYLADKEYLEMVDGLKPDKELHAIRIDLEPVSGSPVQAHSRAQINFFLFKVEKYKIMKNFPSALLPIFWIDEYTVLPDFLIKEIKMGLKLMMVGNVFKYIVLLGALGALGGGGFLQFKEMQGNEVTIRKTVEPKSGGDININVASNGNDKKLPTVFGNTAPSGPLNIE